MKSTAFLMAATLVLATASTAGAQVQNCTGTASAGPSSCTVTNTVSATVPYVARLTLSQAATTLTAPAAADFGTTGVVDAAAITIDVKANSAYTLTASAATANFSGPSGSAKRAGTLAFTTNASTYTALSTTGGTVGTGSAATAGTVFTIGYRTAYAWTVDAPGTYSLAVNYTLTAP
jgi:hypothetical protein